MRCRNTRSVESIRATCGVPGKLLRLLPNTLEQDSRFALVCAKSTLVCGRAFRGTKLKCATRSGQRDGQRDTPIRLRQEGNHLSTLSHGFAGRLPSCWEKQRSF